MTDTRCNVYIRGLGVAGQDWLRSIQIYELYSIGGQPKDNEYR